MIKDRFINLKFQNKLLLVFGIFMLMVAALGIFSISTISNIQQSYLKLSEGPQRRLTYLSDGVRELTNIRRYILSMGYTTEEATVVESYYEKYQDSAKRFLEYMDSYYENIMSDTILTEETSSLRQSEVSDIKNQFENEYLQYVNGIYQASIEKDRKKIDDLMLGGISLGDDLTAKLDHLRNRVYENAHERDSAAQQYAKYSKNTVIIFSSCILILALLVAIFMPSVIKAPIINMQNAMKEIAKGDLTYPIRNGYTDEMGVLSNSIGDMVDTISMLNKTVTIMDNLDYMIFVTDFDYNIIYINQTMADLYGIYKEEALNAKCHDVFYKTDTPCSFCPLPKLLPDRETLPSCEWEQFLDEKSIWLDCRSSIIQWLDGSLVQICTRRDNTLSKQHEDNQMQYAENMRNAAETAKEASRMKSVFLANMSHEIRTPMNGIIGFSELALDDDITKKTRDYLEKIKSSSEGLLNIINDILDISKIEAGKISLENIPFDIHEVFRVCQIISTPKALEKGITLFCYAEPSIGKKLMGDPTRLRQVLLNLLSNAIKFTHVGIVKLLSSISESNDGTVTIHFEVKDSGIGLSPEQIAKIFEPFIQADDTTTRNYGGTGLGLAITKNIIELMGGSLHVESTPGVGSKFSFDLMYKTIDMDADIPFHAPTVHIIEKPIFEGNVLICEDNTMNQKVICDHLSRVGLHSTVTANGKECIACVQQRINENAPPFDLIFMDIHMPIMDGLEAATRLNEMGSMTPIVALTANIMPNDREIYQKAGMPECLPKPFTAQELWGCLLRYFTPSPSIRVNSINKREPSFTGEKLHNQLLSNFWEDNQTTFEDINNAIASGDIKLAHRLAHTLKGIAALIGKSALKESAQAIELSLKYGKPEVTEEQMYGLEVELSLVMDELALLFGKKHTATDVSIEKPAPVFEKTEALQLIEKLEQMLKVGDSDSLDLIDGLHTIPGTELLIESLEHFNFASAYEMLSDIKQKLEDGTNG